jgi:phosphoribosylformylglycinamidine cyclo-ligase
LQVLIVLSEGLGAKKNRKIVNIAMDSYLQRGVSSDKEELHKILEDYDKGLRPSAFCKILPDLSSKAEDSENGFILHSDTAGTKPILAYLYWKETGDLSVWEGIIQDALVMNLDDIACTGVFNFFAFNSTIARNRGRIPNEILHTLIKASYDWVEKLADWGITAFHAGGETADVGDIVRTIDVGFSVAARAPLSQIQAISLRRGRR